MPRNVSFYGKSGAPLYGRQIERDYQTDPRRLMAESILQQGVGPVQSPTEGMLKALQQGVAGYFAGQARNDMKARKSAANQGLMQALTAANAPASVAPAYEAVTPGSEQARMLAEQDAGMFSEADMASPAQGDFGLQRKGGGTTEALANALVAGAQANPDLSGMAQQAVMGNMQQQAAQRQAEIARAQQLADLNAKFEHDKELRASPKWTAPKTPKDPRTTAMKNAEAIGGAPGTPGYKKALEDIMKKTPLIGGEQEKEEDKAYGKELVNQYSKIQEAANVAQNAINQLEQARAFNDTDEAGVSLPSVLQQKVGNVITALGGDVTSPGTAEILGNITNGQQFVAVTKNIVLSKMQAQKGPQTKEDMLMIEQTVAGLGNTPEARDFLLRSAQAAAAEDMFKADFWRNHKNTTGSFQGAAGEWAKFRNKVPFLAVSKGTGKPVFFADFVRANRGADMGELIQDWATNYGK